MYSSKHGSDRFPEACLPTTYCRDLVLWIWVAWVFDIEEHFKEATATAIKQCTESLQTMDLPIPEVVLSTYAFDPQQMNKRLQPLVEIELKRCQTIESLIEELHQCLEMYRRTDYACPYNDPSSFKCGSFLLGSMIKEISQLGLWQPRPERPFLDLSFAALCEQLNGVQSASWLQGSYITHLCNLERVMETLIADVSKTVEGLSLSELKHR